MGHFFASSPRVIRGKITFPFSALGLACFTRCTQRVDHNALANLPDSFRALTLTRLSLSSTHTPTQYTNKFAQGTVGMTHLAWWQPNLQMGIHFRDRNSALPFASLNILGVKRDVRGDVS